MRRVEWSEDLFQLRVVRVDDDVSRVEAEPLPPARLEPLWAFRADQHEQAARRSRSFEFKDCAGIRFKAGARHCQLCPTVHNRKRMEEPGAYVGTRASAHKHASQSGGRFYADEFGRSGAEGHGEATAACGDLEAPPSTDLEPPHDSQTDDIGLPDVVPLRQLT